jgi:hypothetical protein
MTNCGKNAEMGLLGYPVIDGAVFGIEWQNIVTRILLA